MIERNMGTVTTPIRTSLLNRQRGYAIAGVAEVYGGLISSLFLALFLASRFGPLFGYLVVPVLGTFIYKATIVLHDCGHYSLFASRRTNTVVGTLTAWIIGTDFRSFQKLHWQHHTRYGTPQDPQGRDYVGLQTHSRLGLICHLLRPLIGLNLFKLGQFQEAVEKKSSSKRQRVAALAGIGISQLVIAAAATRLGSEPWLFFLYPVSAATFGLFYSQTRGFCEHVPDGSQMDGPAVRTHTPFWVDRIFFYSMNFNYHVEHHLHPSIPSCRLPEIHAQLIRDGLSGSVSPSIFRTIRVRLSACPR